VKGPQGVYGTQGTKGTQGPNLAGTRGTQGNYGVQGIQGTGASLQGVQGTVGSVGISIQGDVGVAEWGITGSNYWLTITGIQGAQGTQGAPGVQGTKGASGARGTRGYKGTWGTYGTQGISGAEVIADPWICETNPTRGSVFPTQHLDLDRLFENYSYNHAPEPAEIYIPTTGGESGEASNWIGLPVITDKNGRLLVAFPLSLFDSNIVMENDHWISVTG
jgi:hypothetical protein